MDGEGATTFTAERSRKEDHGLRIPGGRLQIPEHITNDMLCNSEVYPQWPYTEDGQPQRNTMEYLEYGKDNY